MFELTQSASQELTAYFKDNDKAGIRIYLASGGCSGPRLSIALDEAGDDDQVFEDSGFTFCINKELLTQAESVCLDCNDTGFVLKSGKPLSGAGGGCGGCGGGCHSH